VNTCKPFQVITLFRSLTLDIDKVSIFNYTKKNGFVEISKNLARYKSKNNFIGLSNKFILFFLLMNKQKQKIFNF